MCSSQRQIRSKVGGSETWHTVFSVPLYSKPAVCGSHTLDLKLIRSVYVQGNKRDNVTVIYTPWSNLRKDGSMAIGQVSFHDPKKVVLSHDLLLRIIAFCHFLSLSRMMMANRSLSRPNAYSFPPVPIRL